MCEEKGTYTNNYTPVCVSVCYILSNAHCSYTLTLMITASADRLTPQASVAVDTRTLIRPLEKRCSTTDRLVRNIPAWWMLKPSENKSLNCLLVDARTCK